MDLSRQFTSFGQGDLIYLRKVYGWFLAGVLLTASTAWIALTAGGNSMSVTFDPKYGSVMAPPIVAVMASYPIFFAILFLGLAVVAAVVRRTSGTGPIAYLAFTSFNGFFIGPLLFWAQWKAANVTTLSAHPIRDAFFLTTAAFVGLTAYTYSSKKDFSGWGASLWVGLIVSIVATFMGFFFQSRIFELAVDSMTVLVFAGYIIYDTYNILQKTNGDDPMGDALNLFLDVDNMFIRIISILSSSKDD